MFHWLKTVRFGWCWAHTGSGENAGFPGEEKVGRRGHSAVFVVMGGTREVPIPKPLTSPGMELQLSELPHPGITIDDFIKKAKDRQAAFHSTSVPQRDVPGCNCFCLWFVPLCRHASGHVLCNRH